MSGSLDSELSSEFWQETQAVSLRRGQNQSPSLLLPGPVLLPESLVDPPGEGRGGI